MAVLEGFTRRRIARSGIIQSGIGSNPVAVAKRLMAERLLSRTIVFPLLPVVQNTLKRDKYDNH